MRAHAAALTDVERVAGENQRCYFRMPDTAAGGPAPIAGGDVGHEPCRFVGGVVRPEVMHCGDRVGFRSEVHGVSERRKDFTIHTHVRYLPYGSVAWLIGPQFKSRKISGIELIEQRAASIQEVTPNVAI